MEDSKDNNFLNVNLESWKSPGNLFLKMVHKPQEMDI